MHAAAIERVAQALPKSDATPIGLRLVNVWKRFGGVVAVKDVSFTAFAGAAGRERCGQVDADGDRVG